MSILESKNATPRCQCVVDLVSRVQRPYLFLVTVWGEFPHCHTRKYHVAADTDDSAAKKGLELFVKEFSSPAVQIFSGTIAPKAKLQ
jgi:hypothetical protein